MEPQKIAAVSWSQRDLLEERLLCDATGRGSTPGFVRFAHITGGPDPQVFTTEVPISKMVEFARAILMVTEE